MHLIIGGQHMGKRAFAESLYKDLNLNQADEYGFYTLWDENEPDNLPIAKRKSPK